MSFNIEGFWSILNEIDIPSFVLKYDIVVLVETFANTIPESMFTTHKLFQCPGVKLSDSIQGRLSGGVAVLIKNELCDHVEHIHIEIDNLIVIKIAKHVTGLETDCLFIAAYLPPEGSKYYEGTDIYNGVSMLEDCILDLINLNGEMPLIICGDLNSRTSNKNSSMSNEYMNRVYDVLEKDDVSSGDQSTLNKRSSKDSCFNIFGRYLLNVCDSLELSIVNGLITANASDDYTFISHAGCSVIDYFIVSNILLERCVKLNVVPMVESKHACVELLFSCSNCNAFVVDEPKSNIQKQSFTKFIWDENKKMDFMTTLTSDYVSNKMKDAKSFIELDINVALGTFNECLIEAGCAMKKTVIVGSEKRRVWFDLECKQSRKLLRQNLRRFNRSNNDADRLAYTQKRREYKELLRKKKKTHKENLLTRLQQNRNNPKEFWDCIRSTRPIRKTQSTITKQQWHDHFKDVFNSDALNNKPDDDLSNIAQMNVDVGTCDSINPPIREQEIRNAIKALKSNKSAGPDAIIGEFF